MTDDSETVSGAGDPPAPLTARDPALRVLLIEDYQIYRHGLRMILELEDDIEVVGESSTAQQGLQAAIDLEPDVVVLDIYLPDANGIGVCREITTRLPHAQVLMLTASEDESDLVEAVRAGAKGYLLKDIAPDQLPSAVRGVADGQPLLSPALASTLFSEFAAIVRGTPARGEEPAGELTDRELEVLALVARGWSNRRVAGELFIAENTVKNHVRNILEKLQLRTRMEAAMYAVRGGLIGDPAERKD